MNPNPAIPLNAEEDFAAARSELMGPALGVIILSAIMCFIFFLDFFLFAFGAGSTEMMRSFSSAPELGRAMQWFMPLLCAAVFCVNAFAIFCGVQMYRLRSWPLAMAGAILAMLPITTSACCVFGLPIGIWALVVLQRPHVKAAFR